MKRILLVLTLFADLVLSSSGLGTRAHAQLGVDRPEDHDQRFGFGLIVGEPIGISGKAWLRKENAVVGGLAYSFDDYLLIYADYLWHSHELFGDNSARQSQLIGYFGMGVALGFPSTENNPQSETFLLRAPIGVEWFPSRNPFGLSLEVVPSLRLVSDFNFKLYGGLVVRYYF